MFISPKKKSSDNRFAGKPGFGSSGKNNPRGGQAGGKKKYNIPTFDPSNFIKKVEEHVVAPAYVARNKFSSFGLERQLENNIAKKGYEAPTPIQDQVIEHILNGSDAIGAANTGTGKTAAFLIPLINNVMTKKTSRVLIIAPTRELAVQIQDEFKSFATNTGLFSALCIGGASIGPQERALKAFPHFVIGTPGRLRDLESNQSIQFGKFTSVVLDEVDRMLDMGFIRDIRYIIDRLPKSRHSLFFSATMTPELRTLMNTFLHNPVSVNVRTRESAENVNQEVIKIGLANKVELLHDLLIKPEFKKVLLFLHTKRAVDKLAKELTVRGFSVALIHGNKSQAQRSKALATFKTSKVSILLATDVVARGIDIDDITHVINYDLPQSHEDYIHRIGRTGRADKVGQAITFV